MKKSTPIAAIVSALLVFGAGCATPALWDEKEHQPVSGPALMSSPQATNVLVRFEQATFAARQYCWQTNLQAYWFFPATNRPAPARIFSPTNLTGCVPIPVVSLNLPSEPPIHPVGLIGVPRGLASKADLRWLWHNDRQAPTAPRGFALAANAAGQMLYITNAPPACDYYLLLSASPQRYIMATIARPDHGYCAAVRGDTFTLWLDGQEVGTYHLSSYTTFAPATTGKVLLTPLAVTADAVLVGTAILILGMGGG